MGKFMSQFKANLNSTKYSNCEISSSFLDFDQVFFHVKTFLTLKGWEDFLEDFFFLSWLLILFERFTEILLKIY